MLQYLRYIASVHLLEMFAYFDLRFNDFIYVYEWQYPNLFTKQTYATNVKTCSRCMECEWMAKPYTNTHFTIWACNDGCHRLIGWEWGTCWWWVVCVWRCVYKESLPDITWWWVNLKCGFINASSWGVWERMMLTCCPHIHDASPNIYWVGGDEGHKGCQSYRTYSSPKLPNLKLRSNNMSDNCTSGSNNPHPYAHMRKHKT